MNVSFQLEIKRRLRARKSGSREKREMKDMYVRREKKSKVSWKNARNRGKIERALLFSTK